MKLSDQEYMDRCSKLKPIESSNSLHVYHEKHYLEDRKEYVYLYYAIGGYSSPLIEIKST